MDNTKLLFTSLKMELDVYKIVACDKIHYRIYHNGKRIITSNFKEVEEYLKNNNK